MQKTQNPAGPKGPAHLCPSSLAASSPLALAIPTYEEDRPPLSRYGYYASDFDRPTLNTTTAFAKRRETVPEDDRSEFWRFVMAGILFIISVIISVIGALLFLQITGDSFWKNFSGGHR